MCGELGTLEFGHRLQASMTRATGEDSTAGWGQTLRRGRLLVGPHGTLRRCARILSHMSGQEEFKPGVDETPRPMQAWFPDLGGVGQVLVTRAPVQDAAKTRLKARTHTH